MTKNTCLKMLLIADLMVLIIMTICFKFTMNVDAASKQPSYETKMEKQIKSYAKKSHKAKGIRIVSEGKATKANLKKYKKQKKDLVMRVRVKLLDEFGGCISTDKEKGYYIDGVRDDWEPGTKATIYFHYNWKTKKFDRKWYAYKGM